MSMITYYITHTFRNCIRKLFKSKGGLVIVVMLAIFLTLGVVGGKKGKQSSKEQTGVETQVLEETKSYTGFKIGISAAILLFFALELLGAGSKGTKIFQMPDVNFLFSAPIYPQTVLLFRILIQMGASLAASIFMIFQFPNLIERLHISLGAAFGILLVYYFLLVLCMLCSTMIYCLFHNREKLQMIVNSMIGAVLGALVLAFVILVRIQNNTMMEALDKLLNGAWFRQIPVIGWLKGMAEGFLYGNTQWIVLYGALIVLTIVIVTLIVYRTRVDFYEEAAAGAAKTQETLNSAKEGRVVNQKRSDKIERNVGFTKGQGAEMFYHKTMYNQKRFAKLYFLTPAGEVYGTLCILLPIFMIFLKKSANFEIYAGVLLFLTFFNSMGSGIAEELSLNYLFLVPDSERKKVLYCALGDVSKFLMNTALPYVIGCMILKADLLLAFACYLLIVSFYYLANQFSAWIDLLCPSTIDQSIRTVVCMLFRFFAVVPGLAAGLLTFSMAGVIVGICMASLATALMGALFMVLCPSLLWRGRS